MAYIKDVLVQSPTGKHKTDFAGSAVSVVRMDSNKSYAGIAELLQDYINKSDEGIWRKIRTKIDYTYENLDRALGPLETETYFGRDIKSRIDKGQKLFFKPNIVNVFNIDPQTHGPGQGETSCTQWPFLAALMRWFHDRLEINYHQMCVGEAASTTPAASGLFTMINPEGNLVFPEAVIEGKAGEFYGGWGFYFVRKYLAQSHNPSHNDDPMNGYDESVNGTWLPPGEAGDKLMVYDLNRTSDDPSKGREIAVADGVNFKSITLSKVIVGGDPADPQDMKAYPSSVLVNVPKMKVHAITLLTNVIKNLGIGLYPMQAAEEVGSESFRWKYGFPHNTVPGLKAGIPHSVWVADIDPITGIPRRDDTGKYIVKKTGGILATMVDIIKAVSSQGILMLHVVDAIEAINLDHTGSMPGTKEEEGLVFASLDPVAIDLLCARYMFSNVSLKEAQKTAIDDGNGGHFPQKVPIPILEGNDIVTNSGYDCPLSRDRSFQYAETRILGKRQYHVIGRDAVSDSPMVSIKGHLGTLSNGTFLDLITRTLYFDANKILWDLQLTTLAYLDAVDKLEGSTLKNQFLEAFDEDGDGVVSYEEFGKDGSIDLALSQMGIMDSLIGTEKLGIHHGSFTYRANLLKLSNVMWNSEQHELLKSFGYNFPCLIAYRMSQIELELPDPFQPNLTWGKGKWPSFQLASYIYMGGTLYGPQFPNEIGIRSLYGHTFRYADLTQNEGRYTGDLLFQPAIDGAQRYITDVLSGQAKPLDFTLYVPSGYGNISGNNVPNVEETSDPNKILTAIFSNGKEVWGRHDRIG